MRALIIAAVLGAAASAHAAPWSFNLPDGYTELPGAANAYVEKLRDIPRTVSADAQLYTPPGGAVQLTRITLRSQFDEAPTRDTLENMDRGAVESTAKQVTKRISATRQFHGDQLVANQVDEMAGLRVTQRRLYAADTSNVVHLFTVMCAGPTDQLAECEKAQQSMVLMLPNQASLDVRVTTSRPDQEREFLLGQIAGGVIVLVLVIWYVARRRKRR